MRILFVENHEIFASTVQAALLRAHVVVIVPSLLGANAAMAASPFDAVLVDYDLDDCKGDEVVKSMRENGFDGPILAVSSHEIGNDKLIAAGADAACSKMKFGRVAEILLHAIETRKRSRSR